MYCVRLLRIPSVGIYHRSFNGMTCSYAFYLEILEIQNISLFTFSTTDLPAISQPPCWIPIACLPAHLTYRRQHFLRVLVSPSPFPIAAAYV